jgi:DUF1016 N-terminal domain
MNYKQLLSDIGNNKSLSRTLVARSINQTLVLRNWLVGAYIIEFEQKDLNRAAYGNQLLKRLASDLNARGIKGCSLSNLKNYCLFALEYAAIVETSLTQILLAFQGNACLPPISQTASGQFEFSDQDLLEILSETQDKEKLIQLTCTQGRYSSAILQTLPAEFVRRLRNAVWHLVPIARVAPLSLRRSL